jgi:hypothetical protein
MAIHSKKCINAAIAHYDRSKGSGLNGLCASTTLTIETIRPNPSSRGGNHHHHVRATPPSFLKLCGEAQEHHHNVGAVRKQSANCRPSEPIWAQINPGLNLPPHHQPSLAIPPWPPLHSLLTINRS